MATYIRPGEVVEVTASADLVAGDVVSLGSRIAIAGDSVKSGAVLNCHVVGIFEFDKTESLAISQGDAVYFNTETKKITKTATDVPAGWAVKAAAATDATVEVKIDCVPAAAEG